MDIVWEEFDERIDWPEASVTILRKLAQGCVSDFDSRVESMEPIIATLNELMKKEQEGKEDYLVPSLWIEE